MGKGASPSPFSFQNPKTPGAMSDIEELSSRALAQIEAAPEMRGRVLALQAMLFLGSTPIGGPIVGWISQQFGARYAIGVGAAAALAAGTWGLVRARRASRKVVVDQPMPPEVVAALNAELAR